MIPRTETIVQRETSWQQIMRDLIRDPVELLTELELDPAQYSGLIDHHSQFPLRVPRPFVARMQKGNWQDPLLQQVLPLTLEQADQPGFELDPLQELQQNPQSGLIQKYHGRVLLVLTGACAIHCRYCFRQHFPYADNRNSRQQWQQTLQRIAADPEINEVILSGGDPLSVSDDSLTWIIKQIEQIPHIRRIRLHSRMAVVVPQRITPTLAATLSESRLQTVLVIHSNHPQELDDSVAEALSQLRYSGITLLNQAVLLAGINDQPTIQSELSERLFAIGVLPYYLHLLDKVAGAGHYAISDLQARQLYRQLLSRLPGFLVPKLVRESANIPFKMPIPPID